MNYLNIYVLFLTQFLKLFFKWLQFINFCVTKAFVFMKTSLPAWNSKKNTIQKLFTLISSETWSRFDKKIFDIWEESSTILIFSRSHITLSRYQKYFLIIIWMKHPIPLYDNVLKIENTTTSLPFFNDNGCQGW